MKNLIQALGMKKKNKANSRLALMKEVGYNQAIDEAESKLNSQEQAEIELAKIIFHSNYPNLDILYHGNNFEIEISKRIAKAILSDFSWAVKKEVK